MTKKLVSIVIVSVVLLLLIYTDPIWTRHPGGLWIPLIFLSIVAGFFWIIIKLIKEVIRLIKNRKIFVWNDLLPTIVICGFLFFNFFNPLPFNVEETIYGKVIFRACYEGTQNQATFKLREGNNFELHWTGVFFYDKYFAGKYKQVGDTLFLDYHTDQPGRFGDQIYMDKASQLLTTIRTGDDSLHNAVSFYYGYCKGLN